MRQPPSRLARRVGLFLLGAAVWTLVAMYPNPVVPARNLARYRRLPLDSGLERHMRWELPSDPVNIESFVDSLFLQTPDWLTYRVPWYVPSAREAAASSHGDCESKAVVLASLLEGKQLPYEIRASLTHLWVDYPGRTARVGEDRKLAYLEGQPGRFRLHRPELVEWSRVLALQYEQLWRPMPPARRAIWLLGLSWVALAALVLGGATPRGVLTSQVRIAAPRFALRAAGLAALAFLAIALAPSLRPESMPARWSLADLREVLALSLLAGAFVGWLSVIRPRGGVSFDGDSLVAFSASGIWLKTRVLRAAGINHFELLASAGGLRPWKLSAALRDGQRKTLLRYSREGAARAALRRLGLEFSRPIGVRSENQDYWTDSDEIGLSLREKAAVRPESELPAPPPGLQVVAEQSDVKWALGYARRDAAIVRALLAIAGIVLAGAAIGAEFVYYFPRSLTAWLVWSLSAILLGTIACGAIALREEVLAWLGGAHVEVGNGELSFHHADGKVESLPLEAIESLELARQGEARTIAVVTPERVIHLRLYCPPKHLRWVREAVARAIVASTP